MRQQATIIRIGYQRDIRDRLCFTECGGTDVKRPDAGTDLQQFLNGRQISVLAFSA
jgi:hypothetical protein